MPNVVREIELKGLCGEGERLLGSYGKVVLETSDRFLIRVMSEADIEHVLDIARKRGAKVVSIIPHKQSLEDLFAQKVIGERG
jgi:hypothetical protein